MPRYAVKVTPETLPLIDALHGSPAPCTFGTMLIMLAEIPTQGYYTMDVASFAARFPQADPNLLIQIIN